MWSLFELKCSNLIIKLFLRHVLTRLSRGKSFRVVINDFIGLIFKV